MNKILLFSHESDIDGLGSVVLGLISFNQLDYILCPNNEKLELKFRDYLEKGELDQYDNIYITDLALYDPSLSIVNESKLRNKIHVFDHHQKSIDDHMNRYEFTKIVEQDDKGKRCGTDLFYQYLKEYNLIGENKAIEEFVELTRLEDTWEWKNSKIIGEKAHDLAILFNAIGLEEYISRMTSKLLENPLSFEFNDEEKNIIQIKKDEYNKKLKSIMESTEYFFDEKQNKFGIVYASYQYRNELAEYIRENNNPENIKYFIIVAMDKGEFGQKSYRQIEEKFDVNEVAVMHGGGGHPGAAGVNITEEQRDKALVLSKREGLRFLAESSYTNK